MHDDNELRVAVVTGGHSFDAIRFERLFRGIDGIDAYVQSLENWADDVMGVRDDYDVTVFYNMHTETPTVDEPWPHHKVRSALEDLGRTERGILMLHHAIVAFPDWPHWSELVGIPSRNADAAAGLDLTIDVADTAHPIAAGLESFEIVDETYDMNDAGDGNRVLLTIDHAKSAKTVAWTRRHRNAPVLCLQLGHDNEAWSNPNFRTILERGIRWLAATMKIAR